MRVEVNTPSFVMLTRSVPLSVPAVTRPSAPTVPMAGLLAT